MRALAAAEDAHTALEAANANMLLVMQQAIDHVSEARQEAGLARREAGLAIEREKEEHKKEKEVLLNMLIVFFKKC